MAIIESRLKVLIIKALMCRDIRGGAARQGGNARWRRDGNPMSSALYIFCARASTCTSYTRVLYTPWRIRTRVRRGKETSRELRIGTHAALFSRCEARRGIMITTRAPRRFRDDILDP